MKKLFYVFMAVLAVSIFAGVLPVSAFGGQRVSLDVAQRMPGLYIKDGDSFIFVATATGIQRPQQLFQNDSDMKTLLFELDFEIPHVPNNAQLVLIGVENIAIHRTFGTGYAVPLNVELGSRPALIQYVNRGVWGFDDQRFETINGQDPQTFRNRMLFTRSNWPLMRDQGLLTGAPGEQFTFGWFEGTRFVERTYAVDRRFFTLPARGRPTTHADRADYEIVRTTRGYFELHFNTRPTGYYGVGYGMHTLNSVVYFYTPAAAPAPAPTPLPAPATDAVSVTINGVAQSFEVPPQIIDGRTMLPLRAIGEALGMGVDFEAETNMAILVTHGGTFIMHEIHTAIIYLNGVPHPFDVPSTVIEGRTFVPIRMLAEAIGAEVEWDNATRTAVIVTN